MISFFTITSRVLTAGILLTFAVTSIISTPAAAQPLNRSSFVDKLLPRKPFNRATSGINAFVNDSRFGSISSQFLQVRDTLKLNHVRILFGWDNKVQPSPSGEPDFSFYDDIAANVPSGMQAIIVLTHIPSWMNNSANWVQGNPRKTFIEKWVRPVVSRYKNNPRIIGYQIWNEPNTTGNPENTTMGFVNSPENYLSILEEAHTAIKQESSSLLVINAATTAIGQNYPRSLDYNRRLRTLGAESYLDIWAIHLYGTNVANILRPGGVKSFVRGISKPVWVTESGEKGVTKQREYVERYWTLYRKEMRNIRRIYLYQFTEDSAPSVTYGLRNTSRTQSTSDLYQYLASTR